MLRTAAPNVDDNENEKEPLEQTHMEKKISVCKWRTQTVCVVDADAAASVAVLCI